MPRVYVTGETIDSVISAVMKLNINTLIAAINFSTLADAVHSIRQLMIFPESSEVLPLNAICLVEMALLDLIGKYFNYSVKEIIQNYCIPSVLKSASPKKHYKTSQVMDFSLSPEEFLQSRGPFHYIKIKVGRCVEDNIHKVRTIRKQVGSTIPISVDANMAWRLDEAVQMISALKPFSIDFYEEPLQKGDWHNYRLLKKTTSAKLLLDESICSMADLETALQYNVCDAVNVRISKCGGILRSLDLIALAHHQKLSFQLGAQVAEMGPLIAAARQVVGAVDHYFTYEAGQPDRFYDNYLVDPMPLVDRCTNLANAIEGTGLGITLNSHFKNYLQTVSQWQAGKWSILTKQQIDNP